MTGATHIVDISFGRFRDQDSLRKKDVETRRLIEIESGKVLAIDQVTSY
jgi:hypothetical protein